MKAKILFVDDEVSMLEALVGSFREEFNCDSAQCGADGLRAIQERGPYSVVVADRSMPGMNGVEFLEQVQTVSPDTARVMLTGDSDQAAAVEAVNRGKVFYFLNKPCPAKALREVVVAGIGHHKMNLAQREITETTIASSVSLLTDVLGTVAPEALGRGQRLKAAMQVFGDFLGIDPSERLPIAALLAPLGYASVPQPVLRKLATGSPPLPQEKAVIQRVPQLGHDLINNILPLQRLAKIVLFQNKHFDGRGFPDQAVSGQAIPVGARMLKILIDRMELEADGVVKHRAHVAMAARSGVYDPWLLGKNFEAMPDFLPNPLSRDRPIQNLGIGDLKAGQVLIATIESKSGFRLLAAGDKLTEVTIGKLRDAVTLGEATGPFMVQDAVEPPLGLACDQASIFMARIAAFI